MVRSPRGGPLLRSGDACVSTVSRLARLVEDLVREPHCIESSPFGCQQERALATEPIDGDEDLVPREIRALKGHLIEHPVGRSDNDFQHAIICLVVRQYRASPGVRCDTIPRSSTLQYECQITPAEQPERRLEEPGTDPLLEQAVGPSHHLSVVVFRDRDAGTAVALVPTEIRSGRPGSGGETGAARRRAVSIEGRDSKHHLYRRLRYIWTLSKNADDRLG